MLEIQSLPFACKIIIRLNPRPHKFHKVKKLVSNCSRFMSSQSKIKVRPVHTLAGWRQAWSQQAPWKPISESSRWGSSNEWLHRANTLGWQALSSCVFNKKWLGRFKYIKGENSIIGNASHRLCLGSTWTKPSSHSVPTPPALWICSKTHTPSYQIQLVTPSGQRGSRSVFWWQIKPVDTCSLPLLLWKESAF